MRRALLGACRRGRARVAVSCGLAVLAMGCAAPDYDTLFTQYREAENSWWDDYREATWALEKEQAASGGGAEDAEVHVDISKLPPRPAERFIPKFEACAERLAGTPEAIPPLAWIVSNVAPGLGVETGQDSPDRRALQRLTEDHAAQVEVKDALPLIRWAMYSADKAALVAFYEKVIETNQDREAQAGAMYNLAMTLNHSSSAGEEGAEAAAAADKKRAGDLFRRIVKDYSELKIAERAKGEIFELENLQIGMVAPDFAGEDAQGREIKLSQYRGQVVVLDFWGFW